MGGLSDRPSRRVRGVFGLAAESGFSDEFLWNECNSLAALTLESTEQGPNILGQRLTHDATICHDPGNQFWRSNVESRVQILHIPGSKTPPPDRQVFSLIPHLNI